LRPRDGWGTSVASVPDRVVRFTEQFFSRLDWLLPEERGSDGTPSITDFIVHELPRVRDRLASDYLEHTLATDDPDVRVWVGAGILVHRFIVYTGVEGEDVEVFWITIERFAGDDHDPGPHWE
jgi:hypothetical protein